MTTRSSSKILSGPRWLRGFTTVSPETPSASSCTRLKAPRKSDPVHPTIMPGPAAPPLATNITLSTTEAHVDTILKWLRTLEASLATESRYTLTVYLLLDYLPDCHTPAALTLAVEEYCFAIDLLRVPLSKLTRLLGHLRDSVTPRFVASSSAIIAGTFRSLAEQKTSLAAHKTPMSYDIQLGHELQSGTFRPSFSETTAFVGVNHILQPVSLPLRDGTRGELYPFAERARHLRHVFERLGALLGPNRVFQWLRVSTTQARRLACEDKFTPWATENPVSFHKVSHEVGSLPVLQDAQEEADTTVSTRREKEELELLLDLLPQGWAEKVSREAHRQLIDIEVDLGRPPFAFFRHGEKLVLSESRGEVATAEVLEDIEHRLEEAGHGIGNDNRSGIGGTLHRISVIRSHPSRRIVGVTLRASRHMFGLSSVLYDVLLSDKYEKDSVLLVGPPGSGKTTMGRDIARLLSETKRVIIVDSSDELGGPGATAHTCIGDARRMSVPGGKLHLSETLIEAVENHTPDVIIADELSNKNEAAGAATAKNRGVRLISSAHGSLRSLIKNTALSGLLGGCERVILSDRVTNGARDKLKTVRSGEPVFGVVVEMGVVKGDPTAFRIVSDASKAVDAILEGHKYECEIRRRCNDGEILLTHAFA